MHFLDNVFPLQYLMYKSEVLEGGRGWLLNLLLRSEAFYHASLALSAYHRRSVMLANASHPIQAAALVQQGKHLESCINLTHQAAQRCCPRMGLGILASVIQLVFFEVLFNLDNPMFYFTDILAKLFTGFDGTWQIHLRAAVDMYRNGHEKNLAPLGLAEKSRAILCEDLPLLESEQVAVEEVVSFRFLSGTLIWLDIISSITAGRTPRLLPHHACVLASKSQTKLEGIMGCRNWVMLQVARIAALHEQKIQAMRQPHFDCTELKQSVVDIGRQIQCGLAQLALEAFNISDRDSTVVFEPRIDPPTLVTQIYAYMASLYLHLVIEGFENLEVVSTTIAEAMRMLRTQIPTKILPALVCPLYVIGCAAGQEDKQFFRDIFSSPPLLDPSLE